MIKEKEEIKFVRYKQGAAMYGMCQTKFERLAKEASATYKVGQIVLVNLKLLDKYLDLMYKVE